MLLIYVKLRNLKLANQLLKVKRKAKQEADQQREMQKQAMRYQQQHSVSTNGRTSSMQKIEMENQG